MSALLFKLIIAFEKLRSAVFLAKAQAIKVALTSAPALTLFPDPWPAMYPSRTDLTTAYTEFETAFDMANTVGGRPALDMRDAKRAALIQILKDLAPYLESVAKAANDPTMLNYTGYDRRQPVEPVVQPLSAPTFSVRRGVTSGVVIGTASREDGASFYKGQRCAGDPTVEANWGGTVESTSCRHIEFPGLTPGTLYYFRACAHGRAGDGAWSDVANLMAA